jgi:DNA-binding NtrC family response regulator
LRDIKKKSARVEVAMMDERAAIPAVIAAIKAGAFDYLEKPLSEPALEAAITASLERYRRFEPSVVSFQEMERQAIENAIAQAEGDKLEAARMLSIGKTTLYRKLREYSNGSNYPGRNEPKQSDA